MHVRGFAVLLSLFAISPLLAGQSTSFPDLHTGVVAPGMEERVRAAMDATTVSGSLLGKDGYPIRYGEIHLQSVTDGRILATVASGANGTFEFTNVPPGDYEVVADKGIAQARERVHCLQGYNSVMLRMNTEAAKPGANGDTISVTALRVPDKAREVFQKAQEAFHKEKLEEAWKGAERALGLAPTYAEALTLRGILKIAKNDHAGGELDFQASIKSDSNYPLAYFALGAVQNLDGHFAEAQKTLEQGLRVQPTSWQGYFELSKAMLGQSDYRGALKDVVKAESMGVNYAPIYLVKAHALMGLKFYGEAATEFEHYLQLDPGGVHSADARKALQSAKAFAETASN
jgi:hypothetical protein